MLVDALPGVAALSEAASRARTVLDVYVEIDVGAHRCGVAPGPSALALAHAIDPRARSAFSRPAGLSGRRTASARSGSAPRGDRHVLRPTRDARANRSSARASPATSSTGAGTGTWQLERDSGVYDELQPGSYVFMDADYGRNVAAPSELRFEQSLYVLASVMSVPAAERAIVDAGLKAFSFDSGLPLVHGRAGAEYVKASDEHGVLSIGADAPPIAHGERVWLIPGHCDPTVNLYDWIVAVRGGVVEGVWPIEARGALG